MEKEALEWLTKLLEHDYLYMGIQLKGREMALLAYIDGEIFKNNNTFGHLTVGDSITDIEKKYIDYFLTHQDIYRKYRIEISLEHNRKFAKSTEAIIMVICYAILSILFPFGILFQIILLIYNGIVWYKTGRSPKIIYWVLGLFPGINAFVYLHIIMAGTYALALNYYME